MDQETREFLDRKFNAIDEKFEEAKRYSDQKFEETQRYSDQKFEEAQRYSDQKFEESQQYSEQKFEETQRYSDQKFEETQRYSDQKFWEIKRHFGVVAEGLQGEIQQVAEGHEVIRNEIQSLREENEQAHKDIVAAIKFSYAELDQRIRTLEN